MSTRITARQTVFTVLFVVFLSVAQAFWFPSSTNAQNTPAQCSQVLPLVQKNLSASCSSLGPEKACYGNAPITVEYQDATSIGQALFAKVGDITSLSTLKSINTGPLDLTRNEWGIAVLRWHSNDLAGTAVGQTVTFVLYGDVSMSGISPAQTTPTDTAPAGTAFCSGTMAQTTNLRVVPNASGQVVQQITGNTPVNITRRLADSSWVFAESQGTTGWVVARTVKSSCDLNTLPTVDPNVPVTLPGLNAFYFSTGIGEGNCRDVPPGTLMVQSPEHQKVAFRANGVDISLASTVLLNAVPNKNMTVMLLQGQGTVAANGVTRTLRAGQMLTIPLGNPPTGGANNGLDPVGPPSNPVAMQLDPRFITAACTLAKATGLQNPCVNTAPAPTVRPPTAIPATSVQATCPDPKDQRFLLPCGPACPAGHLRSNENVCVCPQNCGKGMTNVDQNGTCSCVAQSTCLKSGSACNVGSDCCSGSCVVSPSAVARILQCK